MKLKMMSLGALLFCAGCVSSQPPPAEIEHEGGFRVSVKTNGREVQNFENDLIHRVVLTNTRLAESQTSLTATRSEDAVDHFGKRYGLRITGQAPAPLGVRIKDVITAVGKKGSPQLSDLQALLQSLKSGACKTDEECTFTFDREGSPHKTILILGKGES